MADEPIIRCENLVKIYQLHELEVVALQGLDLTVQRGEVLGLVGASGSGKTTLMNILGGLDRPSAGRVRVDGQDLLKLSGAALDRYRRERIGFVWQQGARNLIPYLNALENVERPMTLAGRLGRERRRRAEALLEAVGLAARRNHRLAQLSGGEQQRVAIAVALANEPSLLLADEPTGEVDSETAAALFETFRVLNREYGLTILIVSHDPELARHVTRRVSIRDGKTSTQTVRVEAQAEQYEELVMLDAAGRLQVPREYLEKFDIRGQARLELTEDGILIRPAPAALPATGAESAWAGREPSPRAGAWAKLLDWIRRDQRTSV